MKKPKSIVFSRNCMHQPTTFCRAYKGPVKVACTGLVPIWPWKAHGLTARVLCYLTFRAKCSITETFKRVNLLASYKDVLPTRMKSFVIYEYSCHCDSRYVGRTSQRLQDRIKQHVPKWLRKQAKRPTRSQPGRSCKLKRNNPDCDSAIGQHLLDNEQCAANYNDKLFKILAAARNSFHLCLLQLLLKPDVRFYVNKRILFTH